MKYRTEILIDLSRQRVIELFDNADNMRHWQRGLQEFTHVSGVPGQPGAVSRLVYQMGKRRIEMTETILERNLPEAFHGTYEATGVHNIVRNYFEETPEGHTRWVCENEFQFKGFMKLMGLLMPGAFKKQSYKYMEDFKAFAEQGISVQTTS